MLARFIWRQEKAQHWTLPRGRDGRSMRMPQTPLRYLVAASAALQLACGALLPAWLQLEIAVDWRFIALFLAADQALCWYCYLLRYCCLAFSLPNMSGGTSICSVSSRCHRRTACAQMEREEV